MYRKFFQCSDLGSIPIARSTWMSRIQITFNSGDLAFREIILSRSCRDSGTRLVSQKRRFRWASMTGQSVNPEQPRGRGATRLELGTKSNEEPNLAPTYSEYRFLENVNRTGQKSGSWMSPGIKQPSGSLRSPRSTNCSSDTLSVYWIKVGNARCWSSLSRCGWEINEFFNGEEDENTGPRRRNLPLNG